MKENILLVLKGFVIGIGKILPGISGAMLAISLGVYEEAIKIISNIFKDFIKNIKFLSMLGIGIVLSVVIFGNVIKFLLDTIYLPTMMLFIGLILGTIPSVFKKVNHSKVTLTNMILFSISSSSIFLLTIFKNTSLFEIEKTYFGVFLIGIIDTATMVIPGISGTAVMMILGCYDILLDIFSNVFIIKEIPYLIVFLLGAISGIFMFSKLMNYLFSKHKVNSYYLIIGFMTSSILVLLYSTLMNNTSHDIIIGAILLIMGYKVALLFDRE